MTKKILDVSGEVKPKLRKKEESPKLKKKSAKPKKQEDEIRKTKAEKAAEKEDKPKKKKASKKKKRVGDLLAASDRETALSRLEEHAAIAGVLIPQDALSVENPEAVFLQTYQRIFKRLRRFSRKMEKTMSRGDTIQSRDVYAYNVLCNQTREVMADMRSLIDMTQMAETLCSEALDPLAKTSAQAVTTMLMTVQSVLRSQAPHLIEDVMNELKKSGAEIGTDLNNQLHLSRSRLTSILTQSR